MNDKTVGSTADALFQAVGHALLVGAIAGILLAAFRALAQLPMGELGYSVSIVAGIIVALLLELGAAMLEAKSPYSRLAASTPTLLLLAACAWLLARKVPPLNAALLVLLGSSIGALAVDFAARRWRGAPGSTHFLWVAAGACLGSGLCLLLLPRPEEISWMRSYGLGALTAIPSGTLICLALRARASLSKPSGLRSASG
jgi:hypothetical protein